MGRLLTTASAPLARLVIELLLLRAERIKRIWRFSHWQA
jgi:hypothetical protein